MPIRFAFSTLSYPELSLAEAVEKAGELGFDGIELRTVRGGESPPRADPAQGDPAAHARTLREAGIEPVCLSTSHALHHADEDAGARAVSQVEYAMDLAAALGCGRVRVMGHQAVTGEPLAATMQRIARRSAQLLDRAGDAGLELLFENGGPLARARPWWDLVNTLDHPLLGMLWNHLSALAAGEGAALWVPLLHTRLRVIRLRDAKKDAWATPLPPGEGDGEIEQTIRYLCGIGFDGWLTLDYNRMLDPALPEADAFLRDACDRIQAWLEDFAEAKANPTAWAKKKAAALRAAAKAEGAGKAAKTEKAEKAAAGASRPTRRPASDDAGESAQPGAPRDRPDHQPAGERPAAARTNPSQSKEEQ